MLFIEDVMICCSCSTFNKTNPSPFMLEYNLQPVITSFIGIAHKMIMIMTIGVSRS